MGSFSVEDLVVLNNGLVFKFRVKIMGCLSNGVVFGYSILRIMKKKGSWLKF